MMESPEGKSETFDDAIDRLTMTAISMVTNTPGVSNGLWIHHHIEHGQDVFYVERAKDKALFPDSISIGGVLETRRWISERVRRYLATNQTQPKQFIGRETCRLCYEPISVPFSVSDELRKQVCWGTINEHTIMCLRCFTRMADEKLISWDQSITFRPMSKATSFRLTEDENNVSAGKR